MSAFACWGVKNILDLYAEGRLSAAREAQVRAHLESCPACRAEARPLLALRGLLARAKQVPEAPAGLAEAILKGLEAPAPAEAWTGWDWKLQPAQSAALLYLALLGAGNAAPGLSSQAFAAPPAKEARP
jgi:anti-sigma factor RsiW